MSTTINESIRLEIAGENAFILYFSAPNHAGTSLSSAISAEINSNVQQAVQLIRTHLSTEIIDLIPSYASILVVFNLLEIDHHYLRNKLKLLLKPCGSDGSKQGQLIELPVYYSLESGIDLARIAKQAKISVEQVISLHQKQVYRVYAIGFSPGFAYLGEVNELIAMPRLTTPRLKVPKGAVAIADRQTAVYPTESPGGWNIIGLCPVDMFSADETPVMKLSVGDRVRFTAIEREQYLKLGGKL